MDVRDRFAIEGGVHSEGRRLVHEGKLRRTDLEERLLVAARAGHGGAATDLPESGAMHVAGNHPVHPVAPANRKSSSVKRSPSAGSVGSHEGSSAR